MQFNYNDDYPPQPQERAPRAPGSFPNYTIDQCVRNTERVLINGRIQVLRGIIIPFINPTNVTSNAVVGTETGTGTGTRSARMMSNRGYGGDGDGDGDSECSFSDEDTDEDDDDDEWNHSGSSLGHQEQPRQADHAYYLARSIREAIYGQVWMGIVLRRRTAMEENNAQRPQVMWEVTEEQCAVKEMDMHQIMEERGSAEDPFKEVAAMLYLQRYHTAMMQSSDIDVDMERMNLDNDGHGHGHGDGHGHGEDEGSASIRRRAQEAMLDSHVMMPLDVLTDNHKLYCVMPYCDGGELFDTLEQRQKFPEEEARYWFKQVLDGVETLQRAGICHRDMSLENLLTDSSGRALIIDLGMCLKIPYLEDDLVGSDSNASASAGAGGADRNNGPLVDPVDHRTRQRCLFKPDRACGKPYYMSHEILENRIFDGHAVDMWALGPLLFLMVCGFPPWEQASIHDQRFFYFSGGHFMQTARSWNLGLSEDLIDLLQRMFFRDPTLRLSLRQVRAHPWMQGPIMVPPTNANA